MTTKRGILVLAIWLSACRESNPPYLIEPLEWRDSTAVRLTFNSGDDRAPVWNRTGDSIYFVADGYPPFPIRPGIVLATPRSGGPVAPIVPALQLAASQPPRLGAAALSPQRLALVQLIRFEEYVRPVVCPTAGTIDTTGAQPLLQQAVVRVRNGNAATGPDQFTLPLRFPGVTHDSTRHPFNLAFVHVHHTHPFHRAYNLYGDAIFRPSWSTGGDRLLFSDGLDLYIWQVGAESPVKVPGTGDGVWPAWSPDGQTIAFTRLPRTPTPPTLTCFMFTEKGDVGAVYETTLHSDTQRTGTLVVMRVDGTAARELGPGLAPAWTPDGRSIIVARSRVLVAIDAVSGEPTTQIEHSAGAFEPAVSPDGSHLAFARQVTPRNHDIWVVRLR